MVDESQVTGAQVAMLVVGQLIAFAHQAAIRHVECAEHGEEPAADAQPVERGPDARERRACGNPERHGREDPERQVAIEERELAGDGGHEVAARVADQHLDAAALAEREHQVTAVTWPVHGPAFALPGIRVETAGPHADPHDGPNTDTRQPHPPRPGGGRTGPQRSP